ncbi:MAG: 16S rRNA (uracil(1498)-N(3))-methyltransferase [Bauldia sp.]|uniref:16S rRNA (uracil(1498)-N(3))-methyltransferase n=1 Tax=Bauldia sp. TaxID=2575872 RepID=UPI001D5BAF46|nr:16S rRNA (uracil(1498)-N(3))-methyltransferase [Bauldia sp.]MCB1496910.1 16S rRNA (uracil(1498)-N(3))-methyltransferase [Bauldia sp.]
MARYDFRTYRLFVPETLAPGARLALDRKQANYLVNVLRMGDGQALLVFNGRDGEWRATLACEGRKSHSLVVGERERAQPAPSGLDYLFAPLKQARLDYMVEKAVEMGAGRIRPVLTQHGQVGRINRDRLAAHVVEAAEQCGILSLATVDEPRPLTALLEAWPEEEPGRRIVFCDEGHPGDDPVAILAALPPSPLAVLVGPEGGFSEAEQERLRALPFVTPLPLGPRILRADTAAVAALALVQAILGDWAR